MVPEAHAAQAIEILGAHHPGTAVIGRVTDQVGVASVNGDVIVGG